MNASLLFKTGASQYLFYQEDVEIKLYLPQ